MQSLLIFLTTIIALVGVIFNTEHEHGEPLRPVKRITKAGWGLIIVVIIAAIAQWWLQSQQDKKTAEVEAKLAQIDTTTNKSLEQTAKLAENLNVIDSLSHSLFDSLNLSSSQLLTGNHALSLTLNRTNKNLSNFINSTDDMRTWTSIEVTGKLVDSLAEIVLKYKMCNPASHVNLREGKYSLDLDPFNLDHQDSIKYFGWLDRIVNSFDVVISFDKAISLEYTESDVYHILDNNEAQYAIDFTHGKRRLGITFFDAKLTTTYYPVSFHTFGELIQCSSINTDLWGGLKVWSDSKVISQTISNRYYFCDVHNFYEVMSFDKSTIFHIGKFNLKSINAK